MRKKTVHKKKVRGFFYYKKHLIVISLLAIFAVFSFLLFPKSSNQTSLCANGISCIKNLSGQYDENNEGIFMGKTITGPALAGKPFLPAPAKVAQLDVLGETNQNSKHIYVDLSKQHLYAFENNQLVYDFLVSTGKWYPTPTGDFRIWIKLRYTRMKGGNKDIGTFYDLPNVPYTMFFYNDEYPKSLGYGIHGAYWHNNFGHPMSHGCINMREADVAQIYAWADPPTEGNVTRASDDNLGTAITIYGETPKE